MSSHTYVCLELFTCINIDVVVACMCDMTRLHTWHDFIVTWLVHLHQCRCGVRVHVWHDSCLHVWHDSFVCVTWLLHICDMTHSYVWHDSFICVTWLIHMCDMTHSYVWHNSFICVTWLIHLYQCRSGGCVNVWHDSFTYMTWLHRDMTPSPTSMSMWGSCACLTWLVYMCDMTHSYVRHDMCDVTHSYVWHDSFICVTWLIHLYQCRCGGCVHVWHDSFTYMTWLFPYINVDVGVVCMCQAKRLHVWHDSCICVTWLIHMCD